MKAIERIAGYACEVNEGQWRELVKVADEAGCPIGTASKSIKGPTENWASYNSLVKCLGVYEGKFIDCKPIPYPDFLAKLKGEEKWEPKNGEEVEVRIDRGKNWFKARFIGMDGDLFVCYESGPYHIGVKESSIRPLRPTITRAEAEQKLKELGVNARIVD